MTRERRLRLITWNEDGDRKAIASPRRGGAEGGRKSLERKTLNNGGISNRQFLLLVVPTPKSHFGKYGRLQEEKKNFQNFNSIWRHVPMGFLIVAQAAFLAAYKQHKPKSCRDFLSVGP